MPGILDFDDHYIPPFKPPKGIQRKTEEERLAELNNLGHKEVSEDYSDEIEKMEN